MPILPRINSTVAAEVDKRLMSVCGFSIDQLMELAGLAVADCVYELHPPSKGRNVFVLAGPGNNGGDGLVASRHLFLRGYKPIIYYPKKSSGPLFEGLQTQLTTLGIHFVPEENIENAFFHADFIIDSVFGFSFKPPVRGVFVKVIELLSKTNKGTLAVDIPSSWDVDNGPSGSSYTPSALISLTAPKLAADHFNGRHFIGGRFISEEFAAQFGFKVPEYSGISHIYEEKK